MENRANNKFGPYMVLDCFVSYPFFNALTKEKMNPLETIHKDLKKEFEKEARKLKETAIYKEPQKFDLFEGLCWFGILGGLIKK
jgi:hypothetical protein